MSDVRHGLDIRGDTADPAGGKGRCRCGAMLVSRIGIGFTRDEHGNIDSTHTIYGCDPRIPVLPEPE